MSHLTKQERCKIENFLLAGVTPQEMARNLGRSHTTINRELKRHRYEEDPDHRKFTNYCTFSRKCNKYKVCNLPPSSCMGKCSRCRIVSCNKHCPDFVEDKCRKLDRSPYVCNGCRELKSCSRRKFFYSAMDAMQEYRTVLVESRQGIDASEPEIQQYMDLIRHGSSRGQALHHMMTSHPDVFQKCEKTIYNYMHLDIFDLPRGSMPRMNIRKPRTKEKTRHKIDPKYRNGRKYSDYQNFMEQHPELAPVQMDSVIGEVGGKVLLTVLFPCGMLLACLRDTNNSQSVIDYLDSFERNFGLETFRKLFPVILTDNGSEFSNPAAIEFSPVTKERRTWVFYCEPNAAWQKGNIENNHTNLRRILPRRTSFNALTQDDIDLVLSHLNSYNRKLFGDIPAIARFNSIFGKSILKKMNISLIDPDEVILDKQLLKGKI